MIRIYLDKQIFSYLKKGDKPEYTKLLADIKQSKNNLLYCYSHALLLDLKNDTSDIKYEELEFIETIVDDNYLSYNESKKKTYCYLIKPLQAFKDYIDEDDEEDISFDNLFDIDLKYVTEEQKEQFKQAKDLLYNQKIDFGFSQLQNLPEDMVGPLGKILPIGTDSMTMMEWAKHFMGTLKLIQEDKTVYKGLRNMIDKNLNNEKFTININEVDFNNDLKNDDLKKSFTDFVNNNINPKGDKEVSEYDFFTNAYFSLDILGISKEPASKVKFRNVMNDSFHSYYGASSDFIVSNDDGFLNKSKVMYKLLNIKTQVLHIDEFIKSINLLSHTSEQNISTFFELLNNDLEKGIVLNVKSSIRYDRKTTTIKPYHTYLGYFNEIDVITQKRKNYLYLSHRKDNYAVSYFYREIEAIVNKSLEIFGTDSDYMGTYNWDKENDEIHSNKWNGRRWFFESHEILLEFNKGTSKLALSISPL